MSRILRKAILLRGATGSGKSTVANLLVSSYRSLGMTADYENFDFNEKPSGRTYTMVGNVTTDRLIIEMAFGGESSTHPQVWIDILTRKAYGLYAFCLQAEDEVAITRTISRKENPLSEAVARDWQHRYVTDERVTAFPLRAQLPEVNIDTTTMIPNAVVDLILKIAES